MEKRAKTIQEKRVDTEIFRKKRSFADGRKTACDRMTINRKLQNCADAPRRKRKLNTAA